MIRFSGTFIPLSILMVFVLGVGSSMDGSLTWERPVVYVITIVSLVLGQIALIQMARAAFGDKPSLFLILLNYENAAVLVVLATALEMALKALYPGVFFSIPDSISFGFLISSFATISLTRLVIFFGRRRGWIEAQVNPVPGGAFFSSSKLEGKLEQVAEKQDRHIALTNQRFSEAEKQAGEVRQRLDEARVETDEKLAVAVLEREEINRKLDSILTHLGGRG